MAEEQKRKPGRPHGTTSRKPKRDVPMWVRVTAEEKVIIDGKAVAAKFKTTSAFIRRRLLED